jgi:hypothetical protein
MLGNEGSVERRERARSLISRGIPFADARRPRRRVDKNISLPLVVNVAGRERGGAAAAAAIYRVVPVQRRA